MLNKTSRILSLIRRTSPNHNFFDTLSKAVKNEKERKMADSSHAEAFIDRAEEMDNKDRGTKRGTRGGRNNVGGRGGCRGGKGGSGGGETNREVAVSKALSKLLRHAAVDAGLKLDAEGFVRVDQVVSTFISSYPLQRECT